MTSLQNVKVKNWISKKKHETTMLTAGQCRSDTLYTPMHAHVNFKHKIALTMHANKNLENADNLGNQPSSSQKMKFGKKSVDS